ncbi:SusC/RagA family TonB-linked outer membrane protein [Pedobacter steynii]|nr:SusC/RagA family TonB-linked outer membrane protein [Pedobacter steynii]
MGISGAKIIETFNRIESVTDFKFAYNREDINAKIRLNIPEKERTLIELLNEVSDQSKLNFKIVEGIIVASPRTAKLSLSEINNADPIEIKGKVTDSKGLPLPGATIKVAGTKIGTVADAAGNFTIKAAADGALLVSYAGYASQQIQVNNRSNIQISLVEDSNDLNEVVVTALGIKRSAKSLTYSSQTVKGDELTKVKDANPINSLTGKVAGLQINKSASGIGGSVRITLRGNKSTRNNQPLYVIDGLPMINTDGSGSANAFGDSPDKGDILSTINPDDIESITVLKGASASALYGSQGSNGAIQINTKRGQAGGTKIDFTSNVTFDEAAYGPKLQNSYLQTAPGATQSWGVEGSSEDIVKDFFKTGKTWINSISLSGGNEKVQNYFSYANTNNKGILPTNTFKQNTLSFRNTTKFFDALTFDGGLTYSNQDIHNRPGAGFYFSPLAGLYLFPRGLNFNDYTNYEVPYPARAMMRQNWWNINAETGQVGDQEQQNPYWSLFRDPTDQNAQSLIGSAKLSYAINSWLKLDVRGTMNKYWNKYNRNIYATTQAVVTGAQDPNASPVPYFDNGRYKLEESSGTVLYGDLLLSASKKINDDFSTNIVVGTSINDVKEKGFNVDASFLTIPNVFQLGNILQKAPASGFSIAETAKRRQVQSVFTSANIGYKESLFLDLTARNDWSSTLAFTPTVKKGYFYYSAGVNAILSELFTLPKGIDYAKLRASYAEVGNDVDMFATNPVNTINGGNFVANASGPYQNIPLKPETSKSYEIGTEWRFLDNRLSFDLTWYKTNTINQYLKITVPAGFLNPTAFINAGNVQNSGIELSLGYDVLKTEDISWNTSFNYTANKNKILELAPTLGDRYPLGDGNNILRLNGSFGDLWGKTFLRDASGRIVVSADGTPQGGPDGYLGNSNPKYMIGWNNNIKIKNFNIGFMIDGRFGGQMISVTQGYLNSYGVSQVSADARKDGGVDVPAVLANGTAFSGKLPARQYYQAVGNRDGILEGLVYSATNIRLREMSVSYKLPVKLKGINNVNIGVVGRNLFFFKNNAPSDPDLSNTTATNGTGQGYDAYGLPGTRSYGFNLKCSF